MQAIIVNTFGGPEVLAAGSLPVPQPSSGEVLVRLHAIGVNYSDTERRRGVYDPPALPWVPGNEGSGVVEAIGAGVEAEWLGRRVAFWAPRTSGTYAEYAVAPATSLFALLDAVDFVVGAALPAQGITAYGLVHRASTLEAGQTALVHAAAGGVGALLIQLLQLRGVRVFGTASTPAKHELIREAGAVPFPYGPDLPDRIRAANGGAGVDAVAHQRPSILMSSTRAISGSAASGWRQIRQRGGIPRGASYRNWWSLEGSE